VIWFECGAGAPARECLSRPAQPAISVQSLRSDLQSPRQRQHQRSAKI